MAREDRAQSAPICIQVIALATGPGPNSIFFVSSGPVDSRSALVQISSETYYQGSAEASAAKIPQAKEANPQYGLPTGSDCWPVGLYSHKGRTDMTVSKIMLAAAAFVLSLPAVAGAADRVRSQPLAVSPMAFPSLEPLYLVSGLQDDGGAANLGSATTISCTNFAYSTQKMQFVVRNNLGSIAGGLKRNTFHRFRFDS